MNYRAYGLTINSTIRISALDPISNLSGKRDIGFELGPPPAWAICAMELPSRTVPTKRSPILADEPRFSLIEHGEGEFFELRYGDGSRFVLDDQATKIWGQSGPSLTDEDALVYFLGPVMGFVLRRRSCLALHAGSVVLNGQAVVLIGGAGAGKSTTTASLALRGWPVLCDDISAIEPAGGRPMVIPAYPRVCLWPDSVRATLSSSDSLPLIVHGWNKRYLPLDGTRAAFCSEPKPLLAAYVLAPRSNHSSSPRIEPLTRKDAVLELLRNTYMNWLLDRDQRSAEFNAVAELVARVDCFRVIPNSDPDRLNALTCLIEAHALGLVSRIIG